MCYINMLLTPALTGLTAHLFKFGTRKVDGFVGVFSHRRQDVSGGVVDHHATISRQVRVGHIHAGAGQSAEHRQDLAGPHGPGDRLPPTHCCRQSPAAP